MVDLDAKWDGANAGMLSAQKLGRLTSGRGNILMLLPGPSKSFLPLCPGEGKLGMCSTVTVESWLMRVADRVRHQAISKQRLADPEDLLHLVCKTKYTQLSVSSEHYLTPPQTKRLYGVLEARLAQQETENHTAADTPASHAGGGHSTCPGMEGPWLVGGKCTIADLACFSWVNWAEWEGVGLDAFPKLSKWLETINQRPAVKRGLDVPEKFKMKEKMRTKEGEEEYAKYHSQWVMKGQQENQGRHK